MQVPRISAKSRKGLHQCTHITFCHYAHYNSGHTLQKQNKWRIL